MNRVTAAKLRLEIRMVKKAMRISHNCVSVAARKLGCDRKYLTRRLKELGIEYTAITPQEYHRLFETPKMSKLNDENVAKALLDSMGKARIAAQALGVRPTTLYAFLRARKGEGSTIGSR